MERLKHVLNRRDQNSQRPKNEREHDGVEVMTEAHSSIEQGRKLVRDEAEGTQYRGQFIRLTCRSQDIISTLFQGYQESLKVIKQQKELSFLSKHNH